MQNPSAYDGSGTLRFWNGKKERAAVAFFAFNKKVSAVFRQELLA
jgi:hypothetical protein